MAQKDIGIGWGDLNGKHSVWKCPDENKTYPVGDWSIVWKDMGNWKMDGRKCPGCDFTAYQHHETVRMVP